MTEHIEHEDHDDSEDKDFFLLRRDNLHFSSIRPLPVTLQDIAFLLGMLQAEFHPNGPRPQLYLNAASIRHLAELDVMPVPEKLEAGTRFSRGYLGTLFGIETFTDCVYEPAMRLEEFQHEDPLLAIIPPTHRLETCELKDVESHDYADVLPVTSGLPMLSEDNVWQL